MSENLTQFINAIMPYVITIVTALLGYVSIKIKNKISKKLDTQTKQEVARATVEYVEQVYQALGGAEKLQKAIEQARLILQEKGISITEVELKMLLESAVYGMNKEKNAAENAAAALMKVQMSV